VGFDPAAASRSAYGLVGMRFRVEAAQGSLSVISAPGQGTRIVMSLPEQPSVAGTGPVAPPPATVALQPSCDR
jgi:nitrate/nitrite-specific signal transduction histidine kinase